MAGISKKNLNQGIKRPKIGFLDIFSETGHQKLLILYMMVEVNRTHQLD